MGSMNGRGRINVTPTIRQTVETTRLICLSGEPIGRAFKLRGDDVIGRSDGATIRLTNEGVSRRHARIIQDTDGYWLEDLGSRNGTLLNGQPVRRRRALCVGDRIQLGASAVLLFTRNDPADRILQHRERLEAMSAVAAGMSHDFSNLLGVVLGNLDSLSESEEQLSQQARDCVSDAREAASQAASIARRLMALSNAGEEDGPIDLCSVVNDMLPLLRRTVGDLIELETDLEASAFVESESTELQRLIMNLIVNAADAMPEGGTIRIRIIREALARPPSPVQRWIALEIEDEGIGISPDALPLIFEPFYSTKEMMGGNGLGLATVYATVHSRGGHLDVTSEEGEGTTFRIRLPECADPSAWADEPSQVRSRPTQVPERRTQPPRVLLVEDEPLLVRSMRRLLEPIASVEHIGSGTEAVRRVGSQPPVDLVLLDLQLPDVEGHSVLVELADRFPHVPVVVCSGKVPLGEERSLSALGAASLLHKPVGRNELRDAVLKYATIR